MTPRPVHPQHLALTGLGNAHFPQTCNITTNGSRYHQAVEGRSQPDCHYGESQNSQFRLTQLLHRDSGIKTSAILKVRGCQPDNNIHDSEIVIEDYDIRGGTAGLGSSAFVIRASAAGTTVGIRGDACHLNRNVFVSPLPPPLPKFQPPIALMGFAISLTCQPPATSPETGF